MNLIFHNKIRSFFRIITLLVICAAIASCARKIRFDNSSIVPAAQGTVKVKKDDNNNHSIEIDIKHLADPSRLQPPAAAYVVWMVTDDKAAQNLGQLKIQTGMFSKSLRASMRAVSPFKPTRIFITAEAGANTQYPSSYVVLNTTSF